MRDGHTLVDARGVRLRQLHEVSEEAAFELAPLTHALTVARTPAGTFLLVFNRRLLAWELPGGWIEEGEKPRACAAREFTEETGLASPLLRWRGVTELESSRHASAPVFGALFCADLPDESIGRHQNEEVADVGLWSRDALPDRTCAIDAALLDLFV